MGYLFLGLALTFGITKSYCGKKTSNHATLAYYAVVINAFRMALCIFIGVIAVLISKVSLSQALNIKTIIISLVSGVATAGFTVLWLLSVKTSSFMLVEVFVMASVILPLTLCAIFYGESIGIIQMIGIALLIVAVYLMCTYNSKSVKMSIKGFLLLFSTAIASGLCDFSQKTFVREIVNANASLFNLYTYFFAFITLVIVSFIFRATEKDKSELLSAPKIVKPIFFYVLIMAVCLFLNTFFKTLAAERLSAVLLYPLNQGMAILLSLLMSVFIFKEKINLKGIIGITLAVTSLILINVLG